MNFPIAIKHLLDELQPITPYVVGGYIRDYFLNYISYDVDLVTHCSLQDYLPYVEKITEKHHVFKRYEAVKFSYCHGHERYIISIARLRKDVFCTGRQADVEFVDRLDIDVFRRDFTINAIYADTDGEIIDFCHGMEDLEKRCVRFIGDPEQRIAEDTLRILRYFRFCARLGQAIPEDMMRLFKQNPLFGVSKERIQEEYNNILKQPYVDLVRKELEEIVLYAHQG